MKGSGVPLGLPLPDLLSIMYRSNLHAEYTMSDPDSLKTFLDVIPDVRDGLTRTERIVLYVLSETQQELNGRNVPTAMLYGRVLEYVDMSEAELHVFLDRLGVKGDGS